MRPLWRIARLTTYVAAILLIGCKNDPLSKVRRAAEMGDARAQFELGMIYDLGEEVPQDSAEAVRWFRKAADQGNAKGQFSLGIMYARGRGVPRDYAEAASWYRQAAEQGYAPAQNKLGLMYEDGYGVPQDFAVAARWFRRERVSLTRAVGYSGQGERAKGGRKGQPDTSGWLFRPRWQRALPPWRFSMISEHCGLAKMST